MNRSEVTECLAHAADEVVEIDIGRTSDHDAIKRFGNARDHCEFACRRRDNSESLRARDDLEVLWHLDDGLSVDQMSATAKIGAHLAAFQRRVANFLARVGRVWF